jgi:hypothetical protein
MGKIAIGADPNVSSRTSLGGGPDCALITVLRPAKKKRTVQSSGGSSPLIGDSRAGCSYLLKSSRLARGVEGGKGTPSNATLE